MKLVRWKSASSALYHWCPKCERLHVIPPEGWERAGPDEAPTYMPSFKQNPSTPERCCHYNILGGHLQFHSDSWHKSTDRVPMPDVPRSVVETLTEQIFRR